MSLRPFCPFSLLPPPVVASLTQFTHANTNFSAQESKSGAKDVVPAGVKAEEGKAARTFFDETFEPGSTGIEFQSNYGSSKIVVARFISDQETGLQGPAAVKGTISVGDALVAINGEPVEGLGIGEINCRILAASDKEFSLRFESYNVEAFRAPRRSTATEKVYYGDDLLLHRRLFCGLKRLVVYDSKSEQDICGVSVLFTAGSRGVRSEPASKQQMLPMFEKETSKFGSFKKWRSHRIPALDEYPRNRLPSGSDEGSLHVSTWKDDVALVNMPAPPIKYAGVDEGEIGASSEASAVVSASTRTRTGTRIDNGQGMWLDAFVYRSFLGQTVKLGYARVQLSATGVPLNAKVDDKGNVVIEVYKERESKSLESGGTTPAVAAAGGGAGAGGGDADDHAGGKRKDFVGLLVVDRISVQTINDVDLHIVYSLRNRRQISFKGLANIILHVLDAIVNEANHYTGFMIQPFVSEVIARASGVALRSALRENALSSIEMLALALYGELRADLSALLERTPAHTHQFGENVAGAAPFALYAAFEEFHSKMETLLPRLMKHAATVSVQSRKQMNTAPQSREATLSMLMMDRHSRRGTLGSNHPLLLVHPSRDFGPYIYCWVNHKANEFATKHLPLCFAKELWSVGSGFKRGQHSVSCDDLSSLLKGCTTVYATLPGSTLPHVGLTVKAKQRPPSNSNSRHVLAPPPACCCDNLLDRTLSCTGGERSVTAFSSTSSGLQSSFPPTAAR